MLLKSVALSLLAGVLAISSAPSASSAQDLGIPIGSVAPGAKVQTLDGKTIDIGSYVGKGPMLIEFWAFWCPNCKTLEPSLMALHRKYGTRVKFLNIAVSVNESREKVKAYTTKRGYKHETVFDATGAATEAYDVPATSYVVAVDRRGKVVYTGAGGKQELEPVILKLLQ